MNCINIVKKYLKENWFDGLYFPEEYACKIEDLVPCDDDFSNCIPGYLHPGDSDVEWYIKQEPHNPSLKADKLPSCRVCGRSDIHEKYCSAGVGKVHPLAP